MQDFPPLVKSFAISFRREISVEKYIHYSEIDVFTNSKLYSKTFRIPWEGRIEAFTQEVSRAKRQNLQGFLKLEKK